MVSKQLPSKQARILVVEDSALQALMLCRLIESKGYSVSVASEGQQALERLKSEPFDLVITDLSMPKMNGIELCRAMRADEQLATIRVVLVTAFGDVSDLLAAVTAGVDQYIVKPYSDDYLMARVEEELALPNHDSINRPVTDISINIGSKHYQVNTDSQLLLKMLVSTYEAAIDQNNELLESQIDNRSLASDMSLTRERFEAISSLVPDVIYRIDDQGCFEYLNSAIERFGWSVDELLGKHFSSLLAEGELERVSREFVLKENHPTGDTKLFDERRKSPRATKGLVLNIRSKCSSAISGSAEFIPVASEVASSGLYSADPISPHFLGTIGIIHALAAEHLSGASNQSEQSFISRLGHEVRTPLNAIIGGAYLLKEKITDPELLKVIQGIERSGKRLQEYFQQALTLSKPLLLLVDDDGFTRTLIKGVFDGIPVNIEIAENGAEAVEKIASTSDTYSLVLMDNLMPVMNGVEAVSKIRQTHPDLPIIGLTANPDAQCRDDFLQAGVTTVIDKGEDKNQLIRAVLEHLPTVDLPSSFADSSIKTNNQVLEGFDDIPGFDHLAALKLVSGDKSKLIGLLRRFCHEHGNRYEWVKEQLESSATDSLLIWAHTLKGVCRSVGLNQVAKEAERLEGRLKNSTGQDSYEQLCSQLLSEIKLVCDWVVTLQEEIGTAEPTRSKMSVEEVESCLSTLRAQLKASDAKSVGYFLQHKSALESWVGTAAIFDIESALTVYDFKSALKIVENLSPRSQQ